MSTSRYAKHGKRLVQGPRLKNEVTTDLEKLVRLFLNPKEKIICRYNIYTELEVISSERIFNLTMILKHEPDFEQLSFSDDELALYVPFIKTALNKPTLSENNNFPSEQHYAAMDFSNEHAHLHYAEKLAITTYTGDLYTSINPFLRQYGYHETLYKVKELSRTQLVKEIILATCIASHGLSKPKPEKILTVEERQANLALTQDEEAKKKFHEAMSQASISKEKLYRIEDSKKFSSIHTERIKRIYSNDFAETRHLAFTSTTSLKHFKFLDEKTDTLVKIIQPRRYPIGRNIKELTKYCVTEQEKLFPPGTQFKYFKYKNISDKNNPHMFYAKPVRSITKISSYSSLQHSLRSELIDLLEQVKLLIDINCFPPDDKLYDLARSVILLEASVKKILANVSEKPSEDYSEDITRLMSLIENVRADLTKLDHEFLDETVLILNSSLQRLGYLLIENNIKIYQHLIKHATNVYQDYLSKSYTEIILYPYDGFLKVGHQILHRPNHGLAHTMRVALYLNEVTKYFGEFGIDENFRKFCRSIYGGEILKELQIVMLFCVVGRKSDLGFTDNQKHYQIYRENSAQAFNKYAHKIHFNKDKIKKYSELIQYMGDPNYLLAVQKNEPESFYILLLMNVAHRLDLFRCVPGEQYLEIIGRFTTPYVKKSKEQEEGLANLFAMATHCISATGDRLLSKYDDGIIDCFENYDFEQFLICSTDANACLRACITEKHYDSQPELNDMLKKYSSYVLSYMNKNIGKLGIPELDKIQSSGMSYIISKITIDQNQFAVIAEHTYANDPPIIVPIEIEEFRKFSALQITSDNKFTQKALNCLQKNRGQTGIPEVDELKRLYIFKKLQLIQGNFTQLNLIVEHTYVNLGKTDCCIKIKISIDKLMDLVSTPQPEIAFKLKY